MFKWYGAAVKCYAFLSDVSIQPDSGLLGRLNGKPNCTMLWELGKVGCEEPFFASRWWERGWTLQELIAPLDVEFYNRNWEYFVSKRACKRGISYRTGISPSVLDHSAPLAFCVAERFSWAADRNTTREEDLAYCLLGLLEVNMPLLYGEGGQSAFRRLQEQAMAVNEDYTLFLWNQPLRLPCLLVRPTPYTLRNLPPPKQQQPSPSPSEAPLENVLATSPRKFPRNGRWKNWSSIDSDVLGLGDPPQISGRGLRLSLLIRAVTDQDMDQPSGLYDALDFFFKCLLDYGLRNFVEWLRPGGGGFANSLYLGAFPIRSTCEVSICLAFSCLG
ncbi:hypothetical protein VTI74DRAFT_10631 [Chaetomium olivicolor]